METDTSGAEKIRMIFSAILDEKLKKLKNEMTIMQQEVLVGLMNLNARLDVIEHLVNERPPARRKRQAPIDN